MKADAIAHSNTRRRVVSNGPVRDKRPTRPVVRYADLPGALLAVDVLVCGHKVFCTRKPGGRVLRAHDEPCDECDREADTTVPRRGTVTILSHESRT